MSVADRIGVDDRPGLRKAVAFTLVELLVVVSIIALLIAILLPSLKKAREQAKDVLCKSNLHQIGIAFTMYAEKYNHVWPAAVDTLGMQNRWPVPFFEGRIITDDFAHYDNTGRLIRGGGKSIFLCPSERAQRPIPNWRGTGEYVDRVIVGGSYSYSEEIHRNGETLDRGASGASPRPPFMRKVDECRRPGAVIALADSFNPIQDVTDPGWRFNRDDFFLGYRTFSGSPAAASAMRFRRFGDRHSKRSNVLAVDTHVESQRPDNIGYNQVSWTIWSGDPTQVPGGQQ